MALEIIPNQPVRFTRAGESLFPDCPSCCPDDFCSPVRPGDYTQFQIKINPCADEVNAIRDPGFNDSTCAEWDVFPTDVTVICNIFGTASNIIMQNTNNTSTLLRQTNVLEVGCYYEIKLLVTQTGSDNVEMTSSTFGINQFQSPVNIPESLSNNTANDVREYCFNAYAQSVDFDLSFFAGTVPFTVLIDEIQVKKVDLDYSVAVCDDDGNIFHRIDVATELDQQGEGFQFVDLCDDRLTITVDWSAQAFQFGCYCICLFDPCALDAADFNNLVNHGFDNAFGWTLSGTNSSISNSVLQIRDEVGTLTVENDFILELGKEYEVVLDVFNPLDCTHEAIITIQGQAVANTPGAGVSSYIVTGDGSPFMMEIETIADRACDAEYALFFNDISVVCTDGDLIPDYKSNCFTLQQDPCTILIEACNDNDGFGFLFKDNFVPNVRVFGVLKNPTYGINRNTFIDSKGKQVNAYFRRDKFMSLLIENQPEYVLDFLSLLLGFDHIYINGTEYVIADGEEFTPIYSPSQDCLARISILVREKVDLVENVKCEEEGEGCIPRQILTLSEDCDIPCILDPATGECIQDPADESFLEDL